MNTYEDIVPLLPELINDRNTKKYTEEKVNIINDNTKDRYATFTKSMAAKLSLPRRNPALLTPSSEQSSLTSRTSSNSHAAKSTRVILHPYVERNAYDSLLCLLSDLGLDWRVVSPHSPTQVLFFHVSGVVLHSTGKKLDDAYLIGFEILASLDKVSYSLSNEDGKEQQDLKGPPRCKSSASMKDVTLESKLATSTRQLKKHIRRLSSGTSRLSMELSSPSSNYNLVVINSKREVIFRVPISQTQAPRKPISSGAEEPSPVSENHLKCCVEFGDDYLMGFFSSSAARDRFAKILKALQVFLSSIIFFSTEAPKVGSVKPKLIIAANAICYHQGNLFSVLDDEEYRAMLFQDRLLLFNPEMTGPPLQVIDLSNHLADGSAADLSLIRITTVGDRKKSSPRVAEFRCLNSLEREKWSQALKVVKSEPIFKGRIVEQSEELPLTDSQGSDVSLVPQHSLLDQKTFFDFVRFSVHTLNLIVTTEIPAVNQWTEQLGAIRKNKKDRLKTVEEYFAGYHKLMDRLYAMWSSSLLLCDDGHQYSGDENIAFSYPGFDQEMFQVGTLSVIRPWRLLRASGRYISFSLSGWEGTLGARSIGKELMQTYPEVQELYDLGRGAEAREITTLAAKEQLHNLMISQHIKNHKSDLFSLSQKEFGWKEVIKGQKRSEKTLELFSGKINTEYMFNPPVETLIEHISGRQVIFSAEYVPVWTQLNWLEALRIVHQERLRYMQGLNACLNSWFEHNGMSNSKPLMFYTKLQAIVKDELEGLEMLLNRLPSHEKLVDHYNAYT